jgi:hypothetical protein
VPWNLPGRPDRSLYRSVVDKNVDPSELIGGLAHTSRSIRITEIAAKRRHFTARVFQLYLGGDVSECHLIARDEQQIGAMRGKLAST